MDSPAAPAYYRCLTCDLIFVSEKHYLDNKSECERYKKHNNSLNNPGYVNFLEGFIKGTKIDQLKNVDRALDFGCGPGPILKILLNRLDMQVEIYDQYFFPDKTFENKRYDLITCTEVFEHLKNPLETMVLLESLLTDRGLLAVKTLFHTTCDDFNNWWYRKDPTHICFYSPLTFKWIENNFNLSIQILENRSVCVLQKCLKN